MQESYFYSLYRIILDIISSIACSIQVRLLVEMRVCIGYMFPYERAKDSTRQTEVNLNITILFTSLTNNIHLDSCCKKIN